MNEAKHVRKHDDSGTVDDDLIHNRIDQLVSGSRRSGGAREDGVSAKGTRRPSKEAACVRSS
jgi:hypothetical protein